MTSSEIDLKAVLMHLLALTNYSNTEKTIIKKHVQNIRHYSFYVRSPFGKNLLFSVFSDIPNIFPY